MKIQSFTHKFMKFYKDEFIYLDVSSLKFQSNTNILTGNLLPKIPAYRRKAVKDLILTNNETMICITQIMYAISFHYCDAHLDTDLDVFAKQLLDSFLIRDMNFKFNKPVNVNQPVPFTSTLQVITRKRIPKYIYETIIGDNNNFVVKNYGYLVEEVMHEA